MSGAISVRKTSERDALPGDRKSYVLTRKLVHELHRRTQAFEAVLDLVVLAARDAVGSSVHGDSPLGFAHARTLSGVTR